MPAQPEAHRGLILLAGHPRIERLFRGSLPLVAAGWMLPGLGLLALGGVVGVGSMPLELPDGSAMNVGLWHQLNWSVFATFLVAIMLLGGRLMSERIESAARELSETDVIVPADPERPASMATLMYDEIARRAPLTLAACFVISIFVAALDLVSFGQWVLARTATSVAPDCGFPGMDWTAAFADPACWAPAALPADFERPSLVANGAVTLYAYTWQIVLTTLGMLMLWNLGRFYGTLVGFFDPAHPALRLMPMWDDPVRRLGLAPLGGVFNVILSAVVGLGLYVLLHRFQQMRLVGGVTFGGYLERLGEGLRQPGLWLDAEFHLLHTIQGGAWFALLFMFPAVMLVCWVPLFRIRTAIQERRGGLTQEFAEERRRARERGDAQAVAEWEARGRALEHANLWPNGDRTARRFLLTVLVIYLGAFLPMVLPVAIVASLLLERVLGAMQASERSVEEKVGERTREITSAAGRLRGELANAAAYVRSLLPPPVENDRGVSVDWTYEPSAQLGGDAFTYLSLDAECDALALLDVCGHGVGPALHGVAAIQALRSRRLGVDLRDPGQVAAAMNESFPMEEHGNLFFTLWYGVFDRTTRRLRYVSAGHPPALLIQRGAEGEPRVDELRTAAPPIGVLEEADYSAEEVCIEGAGEVVVFSDGAFELPGHSGGQLAWPDFVAAVVDGPGGRTRSPDELLALARELARSEALEDDFSVVRVRLAGPVEAGALA